MKKLFYEAMQAGAFGFSADKNPRTDLRMVDSSPAT